MSKKKDGKKGDDGIIFENVNISRKKKDKPFNWAGHIILIIFLIIGNFILWPHGGW